MMSNINSLIYSYKLTWCIFATEGELKTGIRVQGELKNGTTKLEHMLQAAHSNEDALVLLGQLYPHTKATLSAERLARLHEAALSHRRNPDVLVRVYY
jgi:hypothetical protein